MSEVGTLPTHICLNGMPGYGVTWVAEDEIGMFVGTVCDKCVAQKMLRYQEVTMKYRQKWMGHESEG